MSVKTKILKARVRRWFKIKKYGLKCWVSYQLMKLWEFLNKRRGIQSYRKKKAILIILFVFIDCYVLNVIIEDIKKFDFSEKIVAVNVGVVVQAVAFDSENSENGEEEVKLTSISPAVEKKATVTAYNSVPEQTDGNPCISADGTNICEFEGCVVAQNGVPFGSKVEIEGFGVCEVHDRKNSRYDSNWIDVYFGGRDKVEEALVFGKKELNVKFLET